MRSGKRSKGRLIKLATVVLLPRTRRRRVPFNVRGGIKTAVNANYKKGEPSPDEKRVK